MPEAEEALLAVVDAEPNACETKVLEPVTRSNKNTSPNAFMSVTPATTLVAVL